MIYKENQDNDAKKSVLKPFIFFLKFGGQNNLSHSSPAVLCHSEEQPAEKQFGPSGDNFYISGDKLQILTNYQKAKK